MSAAGRPDAESPPTSEMAARLRDADFVRVIAAATGDAVAAAGLLARACEASAIPYQASVTPLPERATRGTDTDLTVALGRPVTTADLTLGATGSASTAAHAVAAELATADDALALAGCLAAGVEPTSELLEGANGRRRPGIGIPTASHVDGLAHSTLVHAPFSGEERAARAVIEGLDLSEPEEGARRTLASRVALAVGTDDDTPPRGARAVERFLRPIEGGRFGTVEGSADVLDATAREDPGLAVLLAMDRGDPERALATWRTHAQRTHDGIRAARTGRYDGLFVARTPDEAPVGTVARLLCDFRAPEPVVLVVSEGEAAMTRAGDATDVGAAMRTAAASRDGDGDGTPGRGRATFDCDPTEFVAAVREAV